MVVAGSAQSAAWFKCVTYRAAASVLAGIAVAFIGLDLAVGAAVAGLAGTGVTPLAGVGAGGPVRARLVVGAVVEVLVAEEAAPALLAIALPGFLAHTVQAAGVTDALIAEPPLPTNATSTRKTGHSQAFRESYNIGKASSDQLNQHACLS